MRQLLVIAFVLPFKGRKINVDKFYIHFGFFVGKYYCFCRPYCCVYILKVSTISTACLYVLKPSYTGFIHLDTGLTAKYSMTTYNYAVDALKSVYKYSVNLALI